MSASGAEPWLYAIGSSDEDTVRTVRLRTRAPQDEEREDLPLLVMVRWPFEGKAAHLPDDEDLDDMAAFESGFALPMEADGWGALVAVVTTQGVREWRIYTQDFERFQEGFNESLLGLPRYPVSFELFEDPDWFGYADLAESINVDSKGPAA